jgi:RimJ/RimL family protein N-acetyltransferase
LSAVETPRLIGRLPALEHLDEFAALMGHPRVGETLGGALTREQAQELLRKDIAHWEVHDFGAWHAFERSTDQLVGRIGTHATPVEGVMEVELAWAVHPDHWGQGYAGELAAPARDLAFSRGLNSVVAFSLPDNAASRRVMEKLGMTYERDITHADLPHVMYRASR